MKSTTVDVSRRNKRIGVAMAALMLLGAGGVASQAGFTDSATATASAQAGRVEVTANGTESTTIDFGGPLGGGQEVVRPLTIVNTGNLPITVGYDITAAGSKPAEVQMRYRTAGSTTWSTYQDLPAFTMQSVSLAKSDGAAGGADEHAYELQLKVKDSDTAQGAAPTVTITAQAQQNL